MTEEIDSWTVLDYDMIHLGKVQLDWPLSELHAMNIKPFLGQLQQIKIDRFPVLEMISSNSEPKDSKNIEEFSSGPKGYTYEISSKFSPSLKTPAFMPFTIQPNHQKVNAFVRVEQKYPVLQKNLTSFQFLFRTKVQRGILLVIYGMILTVLSQYFIYLSSNSIIFQFIKNEMKLLRKSKSIQIQV